MGDELQSTEFWTDNCDTLMSCEEKPVAIIERQQTKYENLSDKYILSNAKDFKRQYAHIYAVRLLQMRKAVEQTARTKLDEHAPIRHLCDLNIDERCIVVGTIYKQMKLKPNILHELSEATGLNIPPAPKEKYTSHDDSIMLEDELQRIELIGNIDPDDMVTGVVLAVIGRETEDKRGKFYVESYSCKDLLDQVERPLITTDCYVLLVSGLELRSQNEDSLAIQLLIDMVTGAAGHKQLQRQMAKICRVVVVGNSLCNDTQDKDAITKARYLTKNTAAGSVEAMKSLDDVLVQIAGSVPVDIMPGDYDPACKFLPQQPLHRCMFPKASRYTTMQCTPNPYQFSVDGVRFLGSSGQPVNDIYAFSGMSDRLTILNNTLTWGHVAPTAPDTLNCYPYYQEDPFVIDSCPHVFFCGNQPKFQSKLVEFRQKQVQVICLPRFATSKTAIMLNLRDLSCSPLTFGTTFPASSEQSSPDVDK